MTWKRSIVQLLFYSDCHGKYHQRRPKMQVLMGFFWFDSIFKKRCSSRSSPWKYQSQVCWVSWQQKAVIVLSVLANLSTKIRIWTLRKTFYKFNTEIGRHPAMPFIVMHLKEKNLQRCLVMYVSVKPLW